jgi:hypothetical protein
LFKPIILNGEQRSELQKLLGEQTIESFKKEMNKSNYQNLDDSEKAKKLQNIITDSNNKVKKDLINNLKLPKIKK